MKEAIVKFFKRDGGLGMRMILAMYLITVVHHIHGGIIYDSQERINIAIFFTLAVALTYLLHKFSKRNQLVKYVYWLITAVLWVVILGFIEGGYNHVFKVSLWLSGAEPSYIASFYSSAEYEAPKDVFFEVTGILTLVPALILTGSLFAKKK